MLCKDCNWDATSCWTRSLIILPVVVSGNGLFHNINFFGTLNLKKRLEQKLVYQYPIIHNGWWRLLKTNECSTDFWRESNTELYSCLYKTGGESPGTRSSFALQLSAQNFYLTIANLFLFEYKRQPSPLGGNREFQRLQHQQPRGVGRELSLPK